MPGWLTGAILKERAYIMKTCYVVGIGPGRREDMTLRAVSVLRRVRLITGYDRYVDIIRREFADDPLVLGSEFYTTGMTREIDRCRYALSRAQEGTETALICSGDAGIYGMASPVLELKPEFPDVSVEIVPGVTAASSGAALAGAPLSHDFSVISLSDRLTSWNLIARRLKAAAESDMTIVLYNPASHGRPDTLREAVRIRTDSGLPRGRVCALARHIGREGERVVLTDLGHLGEEECDMQTTVFIGSSSSYAYDRYMVTPRGYRKG